MKLSEFDKRIADLLNFSEISAKDIACNGIQVGESSKEINKIAFAVDASMQSIEQAAAQKCDMLFVHHGFFWGHEQPITGTFYRRIEALIKNDIALYAVHLPLDCSVETGNNIEMARKLSLTNIETFGPYHGVNLGFKGALPQSMELDPIINTLWGKGDQDNIKIFPFGKREVTSIGIISGGAANSVLDAIDEKLDLFITGEYSHQLYHQCLESKINVIHAGHYNTETFGVRAMAQRLRKEWKLDTLFLDIPTGC